MGVISEIFGYVLNFFYELLNNYGLAIIIFSVLLRLLLLPITIKQQTTMKKSAALQEKIKTIQFKYKNDQEKINQETMRLYKEEKMSPFSGCLSGILQILIILAVFWLVSQPLTYMKKINNDETLKQMVEDYKQQITEENNNGRVNYIEISVIAKIEEDYKQVVKDIENYDEYVERMNRTKETNTEEVIENNQNGENTETDANNEQTDEIKIMTLEELQQRKENLEKMRINMNFLELDLSMVPTQNLNNWKVYVIPGLYVLTSFISIKITTNAQKKKKNKENGDKPKDAQEELMDSMGQMSNTMLYIMPIMSISIAAIAPLGLALYWLVSNILIILERIIIDKVMKSKEGAENE